MNKALTNIDLHLFKTRNDKWCVRAEASVLLSNGKIETICCYTAPYDDPFNCVGRAVENINEFTFQAEEHQK